MPKAATNGQWTLNLRQARSFKEDGVTGFEMNPDLDFVDTIRTHSLPSELPALPNYSQIPTSVLHSSTVETLIGQTEDLMARLKVSVRRNALLEQQQLETESRLKKLTSEFEALQEKDSVAVEKDLHLRSRILNLEDQLSALQKELSSENARTKMVTKHNRRLERYHRRIQKWVRVLVDEQHFKSAELLSETDSLKSELAEKNLKLSELRNRVSELTQHVQNQERTFRADQNRLVGLYESQIADLKKETANLAQELSKHKERSQRLDSITQKQVETENRAIFAERKALKLESEIEVLQTEKTRERSRLEGLYFELHEQATSAQNNAEKMSYRVMELETTNSALNDQLRVTQDLHQASKAERDHLKNQAIRLNDINIELSQSIQRLRKELSEKPKESKDSMASQSTASTSGIDLEALKDIEDKLAKIESCFSERPRQ